MLVKALKLFNDLEAKKTRRSGEIFEVTSERAEQINSSPHGELIEVIVSPKESGDKSVRKSKTISKNKK